MIKSLIEGFQSAYRVPRNRNFVRQSAVAIGLVLVAAFPLLCASLLIVFGGQMLALGLLGDLQVRNFQEPSRRVPYTVAHVLRSQSQEQAVNE